MTLEKVVRRLDAHEPTLADDPGHEGFRAAVAIVLLQPEGTEAGGAPPEVLFIERALREGDPWSGHMAFPGGRAEPRDSDIAATAARETAEEVGLELRAPIGRLDDFSGSRAARPQPLVVSPFVYTIRERPELVTNYEVNSTVWVPITALLDPRHAHDYRYQRSEFGGSFPSIRYDGYTIWGMTYRILGSFFDLFGRSIPQP